MRVLLLYCHPNEQSFNAAIHAAALSALRRAGHEVDDCDLYAEGFEPVLSLAERLAYHDVPANRGPVASHVERLLAAEALVIVAPVWNFGFPALLKGYFDRVFLPGVSFRLEHGRVAGNLRRIRRVSAVMTYGADRLRAFLAGDPPRKIVRRTMRALIEPGGPVRHLACYDMNKATLERRQAFLRRVERHFSRF